LKSRKTIVALFAILIFYGCKKDIINVTSESIDFELPMGFPTILFPEDNAYTKARWELGKKLFYDNVLSVDSSLNCGSCHKAALAFSDDVALSLGVQDRPGTRNSPSLANVAYHPYFTREGGVPNLEMQVLVPIQEHNEFDFNIVKAGERLAKDSQYVEMSQKAYDRAPDYYTITRALANFERTLISGNSPFDQFTYQGKNEALNETEKAGMELFYSNKTNCSNCHSGFNFSNYNFENNGLYENYKDEGRMRLTNKIEDKALFKIPTLRNISITAPYMHDGSMATLSDVVDHYNSGGKQNKNKSKLVKSLGLTEQEKIELIAFLKSLTDQKFITETRFKK
jgi:cytochrome c peroxidase